MIGEIKRLIKEREEEKVTYKSFNCIFRQWWIKETTNRKPR